MPEIVKRDNLNRIIYEKYSVSERYVITYYGNSNNKRVIIKLINNEQITVVLNKKGKLIFSSDTNQFCDLDVVKFYNKKIQLKLPLKIRNEYLSILKQRINLNKIKK